MAAARHRFGAYGVALLSCDLRVPLHRLWQPHSVRRHLTSRVRSFHHYSVGGELSVEEAEVLSETIDEVLCRWCGTGTAVEAVTPSA